MTFTKENIAAKLVVGFVTASMIFSLSFAPAKAMTTAEMEAMIAKLTAELAALKGGSTTTTTTSTTFTRDLTLGSSGADVTALQNVLIKNGYAIAAGATGYFGAQTQAALAKWQAAVGISPAAGYFGPISRAKLSGTTTTTTGGGTTTTTTGGLKGGAGSLEDADYMSQLSNEEVGEGDEDVEVAGLEIEADDSSDIEITAVNLNFSRGTSDADFDDVAEEVSIMLDGEEFARVDADEFSDDDNYDKTVSLDGGAVIKAGDVGELTVAITGIGNLDSDDEGDTWTVEFESVRFRDAQNAVISDSSTGDINDGSGRTFSFEAFATASDLELKVSKGDDEINDGRTIEVDDSNDTDGVEILSFEVEIEGTSDVTIDDLSVDFTSVGAGVGEIANTAELIVDGEVVGSESISSTTATTRTITFDSLDWTVEAGETVEVIVSVDVNDLEAGFVAGATLAADVNPDDAAWDAEDAEGEDLDAADKTGAASSDAHAFYSDGIAVTFVSKTATKSFTADDTGEKDQATFTFVFDVKAFGSEIFVDKDTIFAASPTTGTDGNAFATTSLASTGTTTISSVTTASDTDSSDTTHAYSIDESDTRRFTMTIVSEAGIDGIIQQKVTGIKWGTSGSSDSSANQIYTSNLTDFLSDTVSVNTI
ncbi:peptidoglycan-binding protein [Patescibacteria group bacterium]|nr:peptidoglycan-binding protein [Patescibacteria group bacterium]